MRYQLDKRYNHKFKICLPCILLIELIILILCISSCTADIPPIDVEPVIKKEQPDFEVSLVLNVMLILCCKVDVICVMRLLCLFCIF